MIKITLKPKKEENLERFHPWIFSGAIQKMDGNPQEGDLVSIYSSQDKPLAVGHYAPTTISIRILSFDATKPINEDFWKGRLASAYNLRKQLGFIRDDNDAYRLVHGEGDLMPGLIIDIYGSTAVMQAHTVGMHKVSKTIAKLLPEITEGIVNSVYYKSENTLPYMADIETEDGFILGESEEVPVLENGIKFYPDWHKGQKTGFFLDQRDNRMLVEKFSKDKTVLNMFSYTGGFSLYALRGGAKSVTSIDSSAIAIDMAERNVALNIQEGDNRHQSLSEDAFKYLENMPNDKYDLIILDPPAFAKHRKVLRNALSGYRKINTMALKNIKPGGLLFTFSCSQAVTKEDFRLAVFSSAAAAKRRVRILHQLTQSADHPINIYHPEGEYLKGLLLYVE